MYKAGLKSKEGFQFNIRSEDYEFSMGARGKGITPSAALLASLIGCVGVYIRKYAEGTKLPIGEFDIQAEGELCRESPVRFRAIKVSIDLKGAVTDERRKEALLRFIKNCPVHNTLHNAPAIEASVL